MTDQATDLTLAGLCGALRAGSHNRMLMAEAARVWGGPFREASVRFPLYDGDLERDSGVPPEVLEAAALIRSADAVILVTPEYNQSFSGVLKNALDWISRVPAPNPFRGKPMAILSAADGRAGGARAQYALRLAVNSVRPRLLPGPEVQVAGASREFDAAGRLVSERYREVLAELMGALRDEAALVRQAAAVR